MIKKTEDFTNKKHGDFTIIRYYGTKENDKHHHWVAKCKCGNIVLLRSTEIRNNKRLCCIHCSKPALTHGMTNTRLFNIWQNMISRCYNPNNQDFYNYGARNIIVCTEWKNDFINFYNWAINNGYKQKLSLDRIDNNQGYNPNNCRWATDLEQANNKRNNIIIEYNGIKDTLPNWARKTGINAACLQSRYYNGWDVNKMLTVPPKLGTNQYNFKKVICLDTGKIYDSINKASKCTNIRRSGIWAVCNNRAKTAGGLKWSYYDN